MNTPCSLGDHMYTSNANQAACDRGLIEGKAQVWGEAVREGSGEGLALGQTPEDEDPCSHGQ